MVIHWVSAGEVPAHAYAMAAHFTARQSAVRVPLLVGWTQLSLVQYFVTESSQYWGIHHPLGSTGLELSAGWIFTTRTSCPRPPACHTCSP
jgi:hypothetical protein